VALQRHHVLFYAQGVHLRAREEPRPPLGRRHHHPQRAHALRVLPDAQLHVPNALGPGNCHFQVKGHSFKDHLQRRKRLCFTHSWRLYFSLDYEPWLSKTVEELVWGYEEPLFELGKIALPNPPTMSKFGFFTDVSWCHLHFQSS